MSITDPNVQKLHAWIEAHTDEMVEALQGVLRIASIEAPAAGDGAPFGQPVRDALDYTLALSQRLLASERRTSTGTPAMPSSGRARRWSRRSGDLRCGA